MKTAIIIVFYNNEEDIEKDKIIKKLKKIEDLELCLVNNSSQDRTFRILKDIKERCESNISIVDIKRHVPVDTAIKAGVRYLRNKINLKIMGYISTDILKINNCSLTYLIEVICENQEVLVQKNIESLERQKLKFILF